MNKDLIETPRFNFFIGDEVLLKGKIVGFDVDENKCVENVVRLEYGQTLNVPNNNIYITDDIVDKSKIKVVVPQFVADVIEGAREQSVELEDAFEYVWEVATGELREWFRKLENRNNFARAWLDGYEVEEEKRYEVILRNGQSLKTVYRQGGDHLDFEMVYGDLESFTRERLEEAGLGWVFDCSGIEIEEME